MIALGHVVVSGAALVFAGVLIQTGRAPTAELEGVLVWPGLLLALVALAFGLAAVLVLRGARAGRHAALSRILTSFELVAGVVLAWALVVAVQGYGAFEPWRSPLLLPSAVLILLGLSGLWLDIVDRRP
jgi:hypothetical protein